MVFFFFGGGEFWKISFCMLAPSQILFFFLKLNNAKKEGGNFVYNYDLYPSLDQGYNARKAISEV